MRAIFESLTGKLVDDRLGVRGRREARGKWSVYRAGTDWTDYHMATGPTRRRDLLHLSSVAVRIVDGPLHGASACYLHIFTPRRQSTEPSSRRIPALSSSGVTGCFYIGRQQNITCSNNTSKTYTDTH